jgi:hypothetical protein
MLQHHQQPNVVYEGKYIIQDSSLAQYYSDFHEKHECSEGHAPNQASVGKGSS